MSKKSKKKQAPKLNYTPVYILSVFAMAAFIMMMIALSVTKEPPRGEFVPPAFESMAQQGITDVPEELEHSSPYRDGMAYRFSVCANVTMDSRSATVYFTNAEENDVYLKLRELPSGTGISLKIMSYIPDTYMSAGSVVLHTTIGTAS